MVRRRTQSLSATLTMCGIVGLLNLDGSPVREGVLARMLGVQRHRGPDDAGLRLFSLGSGTSAEVPIPSGTFKAPPEGGLGFNRLSILDLSPEGHQPMCNRDASVFLVFNGEIYNAFTFTPELEAAGFRFHSRTDTEVILYLYERFGFEGLLQRINGMFAIAIVDLRKGELHLARDHFGIKPLYWTRVGNSLMFASEAKAFLEHPEFHPRVAGENLDEYLAFRYCASERTLLEGVQQLRPGHCMRVGLGGISIRRYWEIPDPEKPRITPEHALERLDELLGSSVRSQLLSDVKLGCQLSGGIDSTLVSLKARPHFDVSMESFSIVFEDEKYSEERWIDDASKVVGAESHRYRFTPDHFFSMLGPATWHMDQPINHPNALGIFLLAERARSLVTVLLSGEGADEVFGGYPRHYYASIRRKVRFWVPVLGLLPHWGSKFRRNFGAAYADPERAFIAASMFMPPEALARLRPDADLARSFELRHDTFREGKGGHVDNCLKYDMQTYMVDLLVRQDKMTMAHSMENRVPYLDLHLVNFVRSLPSELLVATGVRRPPTIMRSTKMLLKRLAARSFHDRFVYRSKSGFGLPLRTYYATPRFEELMNDRLLPRMRDRGLVDADAVRAQWRDAMGKSDGSDETFWIPIALEIWAQHFLDAPSARVG